MTKENKQNHNDAKDINDKAFDLGLNKALKKAKRRTLIRNISISALVVLLLFVSSIFAGDALKQNQRTAIERSMLTLYELSKPNQYLGEQKRFEGLSNGQLRYTTYKWLEDTLVYTGDHTMFYGFPKSRWSGSGSPSIIAETVDELAYPSFNPLGQREMIFYYPYVNYSNLPNDFQLLADIPEHKVIELALSFDKVYTLDELQQFIPNQDQIAWYWLDDMGENQLDKLVIEDELGIWNRVRSEHSAFGVKTRNSHGQAINEPFDWFLLILQNSYNDRASFDGSNQATVWLNEDLERLYERFIKGNPDRNIDQLPIAGLVVTGDRESLSVWQEVEQVRAVTLGATADRY